MPVPNTTNPVRLEMIKKKWKQFLLPLIHNVFWLKF